MPVYPVTTEREFNLVPEKLSRSLNQASKNTPASIRGSGFEDATEDKGITFQADVKGRTIAAAAVGKIRGALHDQQCRARLTCRALARLLSASCARIARSARVTAMPVIDSRME